MRLVILIACLLNAAFGAPQFVTFKDGKVGVNFGGYHAEAGLGGLLTGNAAHGGLSASAGTPFGQNAAAGLNGGVDGRSAGTLYAGAQALPSIGASSILSGSTNGQSHGFAGSEAHVNDKVVSKTITGIAAPNSHHVVAATVAPHHVIPTHPYNEQPENVNAIQKIKPPKKYSLIKSQQHGPAVHSKQVVKSIHKSAADAPIDAPYPLPQPMPMPMPEVGGSGLGVRFDSGIVPNILNIPIGILRSLQDSLSGIQIEKHIRTV